jgi:predicted nucleic acid-binding protein
MQSRFIIDTSVVMAWCFRDEVSQYSEIVLDSLEDHEALVPSVWPLEVGNVLLVAERRKRLAAADSIRFLSLLSRLPISVEQESPDRMLKEIVALARQYRLSTYDASYLDLAMRSGLEIATQDSGLLEAAKQSNVSIFRGSL